ncbi:MAG: Fic family protein, partial [Halioglobus sp.]|nr:Fic family protein [Halioglobus sp.]
MSYSVTNIPLEGESKFETPAILKQCNAASRSLAELKGTAQSIPNEAILISTITLQEAKDSSEVENIVTTHDELYKADIFGDYIKNPAAKEVRDYSFALRTGFEKVRKDKVIRLGDILDIQEELENNRAGLRKLPGTDLKNQSTGEVVYTPPQNAAEVERLMNNLIEYINADELSSLDPLLKMAVIHYQFESIHPFYDGNGRTGRILNILYLVAKGLLDLPILYLSRFIIENKPTYYETLQGVRDSEDWESWLLFILRGVEETSNQAIELISQIKNLMMQYKHKMRSELPKIYSQDLLNNLFKHPYTRIDYVMNDLQVSRITASKYLDLLIDNGFIEKEKLGVHNYYINTP